MRNTESQLLFIKQRIYLLISKSFTVKAYLYIMLLLSLIFHAYPSDAQQVYVSKYGTDDGNGSYSLPFNTLEKALERVSQLRKEDTTESVSILIDQGNYLLTKPLHINENHSGGTNNPLIIKANQEGKVMLSGGVVIDQWSHLDSNLFVAQVPDVSTSWYPKQLFLNGQEIPRASIPQNGYLLTNGPLSNYSFINSWDKHSFAKAKILRDTAIQAFCGFQYQEKDQQHWINLDEENAEIITYHSWECSWQLIDHVDRNHKDVYLTSPSRYPVGFFNNKLRYRIENVSAGLDQAGEWYYNRNEQRIYLLAPKGLDPNSAEIISPHLNLLMKVTGKGADSKVANVLFEGITFSHNDFNMRFNQKPLDWYTKHDTWGYSDAQSALNSGYAVFVKNAQNIEIKNCFFQDIGSYALKIDSGCEKINVVNNHFQRLGAGAILLGSQNAQLNKKVISRNNKIENNLIEQFGTIHPAGVGIWLANAQANKIIHNEIRNGGYSGISLGWSWGKGKSLTFDNVIKANHIHHVLQKLADGGGIYTLGRQSNTVIEENYIHHINKHKYAVGSPNNGIFFDEGSSQMTIKNNVFDQIKASPFRFHMTSKEQMNLENNYTELKNNQSHLSQSIIQKAGRSLTY